MIVATLLCSFASSPFPYSLRRNIRARHRNMFRWGEEAGGEEGHRGGRREIARWIFAAGGEFRFFLLSVFRVSSYRASHTAHVRPISPPVLLRAPRPPFWDSALFTVHKALIGCARRLRLATLGDVRARARTRSLLDGDLRGAFNASVYLFAIQNGTFSKENRVTKRRTAVG